MSICTIVMQEYLEMQCGHQKAVRGTLLTTRQPKPVIDGKLLQRLARVVTHEAFTRSGYDSKDIPSGRIVYCLRKNRLTDLLY
jgi:hypothetical protein